MQRKITRGRCGHLRYIKKGVIFKILSEKPTFIGKLFESIFIEVTTSAADPHRKNADADPGKNLNADSCSY
jgi:hypothetical protein